MLKKGWKRDEKTRQNKSLKGGLKEKRREKVPEEVQRRKKVSLLIPQRVPGRAMLAQWAQAFLRVAGLAEGDTYP